mgnify:CR=1 FL=1
MNTTNKEIDNFNLQIIASLLFIISIIISIILTYSEELELFGISIIDRTKRNKINIGNRLFAIFIVYLFLYSSFVSLDIVKEKNGNLDEQYIRIFINLVTFGLALLTLYVSVRYQNSDIDTGQNVF